MFRRDESSSEQRAEMVSRQLRGRGIVCEATLEVMGRIPRERFLTPEAQPRAYHDQALPFSHGQTVSQPYIVAFMTQALELRSTEKVLEIGTGSGYQTAILSAMADQVFSMERIPELNEIAAGALADVGCENVKLRTGDGSLGWPEEAPFDAILVTAGAPEVPESLQEQLSTKGGRLVVPVGDRYTQDLVRVRRRGDEFATERLLACRFVPLLGEEGWTPPQTG